ncbi:hypothetical protein [Terrisporobacter mayombei]|uniref:hypothetical protein n=1 Tax=Terrisporobacter mayombei TaxID=1541 RepID=UPI001D163EB8|nr:hypothetical protein [Terrisporobacter mayombei]MCC3868470.1 hypothetical protein [Terrisporobacter mayombei]
MKNYCFNNFVDAHGRYEIHVEGCPYLPYSLSRTYIGSFSNCDEALQRAKYQHPLKSFVCCKSCCKSCSRSCHRC